MKIIVADTYEDMSRAAADFSEKYIRNKPDALISFPGGNTPLKFLEYFTSDESNKTVSVSRSSFVQLDEWVGIGPEDEGSCSRFIQDKLLAKLSHQFAHTFLFNGKADNIDEQLDEQNKFVESYGPIDLSVLGIGLNGHLGFNEDGVDFSLRSHRNQLSDTTKRIQDYKYFNNKKLNLTEGITLGIAQIMEAKCVLLIANGSAKQEIVRKMITEPVSNKVPATVLKNHKNCFVILDKDAAAGLPTKLRDGGEIK